MYNTTIYFSIARKYLLCFACLISLTVLVLSCGRKKKPVTTAIVSVPEKMDETVEKIIPKLTAYALSDSGRMDDSILLNQTTVANFLYNEHSNNPLWSHKQKWLNRTDSLFAFISNAKLFGLFPEDYHFTHLENLRTRFANDSLEKSDRKDAALWARADILFTDALIQLIKDIRLGRISRDSVTLRKDSILTNEYYAEKFRAVLSGNPLRIVINALEPKHKGYHELKGGLIGFLDTADFRAYTYINYPTKDSLNLRTAVIKRLFESAYLDSSMLYPDSIQLARALKKYQKEKGLTVDGKLGAQTIRELNNSDREKFIRIAITLDRFKLLPEKMPEKYIWVNIPAYNLVLVNGDSVKIASRVVVGKPKTRTPVLNSAVSEMITYPQWTIPTSIIVKEILPGLKADPGYLAKKGYGLFNNEGEEIDPYTVDWSKYKKGIPYRIVQGSGDENALGIMKFNFSNKYSVYLHDTNQRYYFSRAARALSHGCVRVQEWEKMTFYLLRNDSINAKMKNTNNYTPTDSVMKWLAIKEKHSIPVRNRIPLFIRYFTCEGKNGKIFFYEDIYDEDKILKEQYFHGK